jgi:acetoin utilization deacetylase AcuC-like enzyme
MRLLLYGHDACREHDAGPWHPEQPHRLDAVVAGIMAAGVEVIEREAPRASLDALHLVHRPSYVSGIEKLCASGGGPLDPDTSASEGSWEAALRAAGSGPAAAAALAAGEGDAAFLVVRPPGHHATRDQSMGFCLFNNIGVTAAHLAADGARVAIVDWDIHHGNATQDMFYERGDVLYVSTHEFPFYPGSGWIDEDGNGDGAGHNINIPLPAGTAGDVFDEAWERVVLPVLDLYRPDWILVSAGFDGHEADPLANCRLHESDYGRMAHRLAERAPGRLIFFLEGGYDPTALAASAEAVVRGVAGEFPDLLEVESPRRAFHMLDVAAAQAGRAWDLL